MKEVREAWEDDFWKYLNAQKIELLRMKVAPLLRFVPNVNLAEAFFTSKMERCGLALLQKKDIATMRESVKEDIALLPTNLPQVAERTELIHNLLGGNWWTSVSLKTIDEAKSTLAPLMKYKKQENFEPLELDLQDIIDSRKWVVVRKEGQKFMIEEYKKKVEEKIEQLAAHHPTIQRLKNGEGVNLDDLIKLEQTLETELGSDELTLNEDNMLKAFGLRVGSLTDFLKHILKLETLPSYEEIVRKSFDIFIGKHNYNADQTKFLRTVQSVFIQKRKLEIADLYEPPFSNFGTNAVEKLFTQNEIEELMELTKKLVA